MVRGTAMTAVLRNYEGKNRKLTARMTTGLLAESLLASPPNFLENWSIQNSGKSSGSELYGLELSFQVKDGNTTLSGEITRPTSDEPGKPIVLNTNIKNGKRYLEFTLPDSEAEKTANEENGLNVAQLQLSSNSNDVKVILHETKDKSSASAQITLVQDEDVPEDVEILINNKRISENRNSFLDNSNPTQIAIQTDNKNHLFLGCAASNEAAIEKTNCYVVGYEKFEPAIRFESKKSAAATVKGAQIKDEFDNYNEINKDESPQYDKYNHISNDDPLDDNSDEVDLEM